LNRRLTLVACILGSGIVFLDGTVINVALPVIQRDLDAGLAAQQWIVEAYLLTLSSLLLVGGSLDDIFERRTVFATGVAGFGVMSLACAVAPSVELLIVARALQGVFGALLVPSTLAIIIAVFPPAERGAAIGSWTAWTGISTVIGPLGGGALLEVASWRWIFLINVPFVLLTLWLIRIAMPKMHSARSGARVDILGGVLCGLGLGGVIVALIEQPRRGWDDPLIMAGLAGGVAALALFIAHEARTRDPMMPLGLFRERNFAIGNISTFTLYAGLSGGLFFVGLYLQQVAGYSPLEAGAAFLPLTAITFVLARRMGALADRFGPRLFMGIGPIVAGIGLLLLMRVNEEASFWSQVFPGIVVFAFGLASTVAPLTATVLGAVAEEHSGVASGVNNAIARIAGLLAIAVLGAAVAGAFATSIDDRLPPPLSPAVQSAVAEAKDRSLTTAPADRLRGVERRRTHAALAESSTSAYRLGLGIAGVIVIIGGVVSLVGIANPRREVPCEECPGGALVGASEDHAHPAPEREPEPAAA
jgi:EmrB/QacA subfamily drug resistance transporter